MQALTLTTADGQSLAARSFEPAGTPRRALLLANAMGVPQRFYAPFAQWLCEQGVAVLTFDFRGQGDSPPRQLKHCDADLHTWATQDLQAAVDWFVQRHAGVPKVYLGHSLGGQLFGMLRGHEAFERVVTVASGSGYWRLNSAPLRYVVPVLWYVIAPLALRLAGYFPGRRLGAVGDLPAGVMRQWRRWCLHPDYLGAEGAETRKVYAQVRTPITAVMLDDDELISAQGVRALYRLYANAPVRFERLTPGTHGLKRIGHFGLFRPQAAPALWPLALRWIDFS
jgi:predicted alpha/beta hydrolase